MHSRKQYLKKLQQDYLKADKIEKGKILYEYVKNTKHNRKYVIAQLNDINLTENILKERKKESQNIKKA